MTNEYSAPSEYAPTYVQLLQELRVRKERIAELEAELAKAREVPEMPEPDAYMATFKPAGIDALHSVAGSSIEALKYSVPTDSVFTPLLKWSTVRAMFERNKG